MLKRTFTIISLISIFIIGTSSLLFYAAAPPTGYTGATPGQTCGDAGCHDNHGINTGGGNIVTNLPATYTPGTAINFNTIITHAAPAASKWGFSIKAVDGSGNTLGIFSTTNPGAAVNGNELSHLNAVAGPAAASKTFNNLTWMPPVFNSGTITFYYASVTGISGNDYVYTGSTTLNYLAPLPTPIETSNVGIGTSVPYHKLDVKGNIWMGVGRPGNGFTPIQDAIYIGSERKYLSNTLGAPIEGLTDWVNLMAHPLSAGIMFGLSGPSDADPHSGPTSLMAIRSNGNVGIGTSSPYYPLTVKQNGIGISQVSSTGDVRLGFYVSSTSAYVQTHSFTDLKFSTNDGGAQLILTTDGKFGIGNTSPAELLDVAGFTRSYGFASRQGTAGSFGGNMHNFYWTGSSLQAWVDGVNVGTVTLTSDRRLKDQIKPQTDDALARILQLKPVSYHYKTIAGSIFKENPQTQEGFIADELQRVIPSAVIGEKNAVTKEGQIKPQTLNIIPVVAVLTKAIQEQQKQIDQLRSENEKLKQENLNFRTDMETIKAHLGIGSKAQK